MLNIFGVLFFLKMVFGIGIGSRGGDISKVSALLVSKKSVGKAKIKLNILEIAW